MSTVSNRWLGLVLSLCLVVPQRGVAGGLADLKGYLPPDAQFVAGLVGSPASWLASVAGWSLSAKASEKVIREHCEGFAQETGINPLQMEALVVAGGKGKPTPLGVGRIKFDFAKVGAALKASPPSGFQVSTSDGGLALKSADVTIVLLAQGIILFGDPAAVKAAVAQGSSPAPAGGLMDEALARMGDTASFVLAANVAGQVPKAPSGPLPGGLDPALLGKTRVIAFGALADSFKLVVSMDTPESAQGLTPVLPRLIEELRKGALAKVDQTKAVAQKKGAMAWFDPEWLGARVAAESINDIAAQTTTKADASDAILTLPRDIVPVGPAMVPLMGVLAAIAVPNFVAARGRANVRACFANQKTIAGATEMYNLDKNTKVTELSMEFLKSLQTGGYLQSIPSDPGQGPETGDHYYLTNDSINGIACKVHGDISGKVAPTMAGAK